MPEINFKIQWPDGKQETCYSPSLIVKDYFDVGEAYPVADFLEKSREALKIASERVQEKYGFPCSRALGQLRQIESTAQGYLTPSANAEGKVTVLKFEP